MEELRIDEEVLKEFFSTLDDLDKELNSRRVKWIFYLYQPFVLKEMVKRNLDVSGESARMLQRGVGTLTPAQVGKAGQGAMNEVAAMSDAELMKSNDCIGKLRRKYER